MVQPHPTLYHIWPYLFAAPPAYHASHPWRMGPPICSLTHEDAQAIQLFNGSLDKSRKEMQAKGMMHPAPYGGGWG